MTTMAFDHAVLVNEPRSGLLESGSLCIILGQVLDNSLPLLPPLFSPGEAMFASAESCRYR